MADTFKDGMKAALAKCPKQERWYLGAQNDGLFIINRPPRPSNDDIDPDSGPTLAIPVAGISRQAAQTIVDAHNAAITAAEARGVEKERARIMDIQQKMGSALIRGAK